jgi:hypothetical protein
MFVSNAGPFIIESDGRRRMGISRRLTEVWELEFVDKDLSQICFDHQIWLGFNKTQVVLDSTFKLTVNGVEHWIDRDNPASLVELIKVSFDSLKSVSIDTLATLTMKFESGVEIVVSSDPYGEAWQIRGPGDFLVVCEENPGKISVWE